MYYRVITSLDELLGDEGLLRLPSYLARVYVMDEVRSNAIKDAVDYLSVGENVLLTGRPGTGKTALMFMILREIINRFRVGYICEGVSSVSNDHLNEGIILFYDDIPRMRREALISIFKNRVKGIIATGRVEEIAMIRRMLGVDFRNLFHIIEVPPLSKDKIRKMLLNYLNMEAIKIADEDAVDIVIEKAAGLPVYIWQVVRELKIERSDLTLSFAKKIPRGMLDYIDDILWRILGGKIEKYEALITLLIMTDFVKYAVHQDLFNYIYLVAKEKRIKKRLTIEDIIMDPVIENIARYLAREATTYSFRLPHDSWADVLRGKSSGLMAPEIAKINGLYNKERREMIVVEAARRAWFETLKKSDDLLRKETFKENIRINLGEPILRDILEKPAIAEIREEKVPERVIKEEVTVRRPVMPTPPKPVMEPIDLIRYYLSSLKVTTLDLLASQTGMSKKDIKELLEISDFYIPSRRSGFVYYKDYFLMTIKKVKDFLRKNGKAEVKALSRETRIFPEDLIEELKKDTILFGDTLYDKKYVETILINELKKKRFVDLDTISRITGIPVQVFEHFKKTLETKAIPDPKKRKYYLKEYLSDLLHKEIKKNGYVDLEELADKHEISVEVFEQFEPTLRKQYIASIRGKQYFTQEYIDSQITPKILEKLNNQIRVNTQEIANEFNVPPQIVSEILEKIAEKSVIQGVYYKKGTLSNALNELKRSITEPKSLHQISVKTKVLVQDLIKILKENNLDKAYSLARIREIIKTFPTTKPDREELKNLIETAAKYELNKEEMHTLGTAYLILWELTQEDTYFSRGKELLEKAALPKSYRNLAIAYAKRKDYKKAEHYLKLYKSKQK